MKTYTVEEICSKINDLIRDGVGLVSIKGEVRNLKTSNRGNLYFYLKDKTAILPAVIYSTELVKLQFLPKEGSEITIKGEIRYYKASGNIYVIVNTLEEEKQKGNLYLEFEKLKAKLLNMGYFDEGRKRKLPTFPRTLAIITSPEGSVLQDMLRIMEDHYVPEKVYIIPTTVQGDKAIPEIVSAVKAANKLSADIAILARGGGSIEDLWCFNSIQVAQAIYESSIPIVSAIGHQTDFTIADFVADKRAPTPSAAIPMILNNKRELQTFLDRNFARLQLSIAYLLKAIDKKVCTLKQLIKHPGEKYFTQIKNLNNLKRKLYRNLGLVINSYINTCKQKKAILKQLNPLNILGRGYSIVRKDGKIISDSSSLKIEDRVEVILHKGSLVTQVEEIISK